MGNFKLISFLSALMMVVLFGCDSDNQQDIQPQLELQTIGFSGTMPDGRAFGDKGIIADNNLAGASSTQEGSYISHSLSVLDSVAGISILVELPYVKYSDDYILANDSVINYAAKQNYPYQVVKEKLSVGNKLIVSSQNTDFTDSFRVLVIDQKNYSTFTSEITGDQTGSYLKVVEVIEGTETDPVLGNIKTLEVIFDLDVTLHPTEQATSQPGKLKGLLRMKYRQK